MVTFSRTFQPFAWLVAAVLLLPASFALGQAGGRLMATVVDAAGEPVPDVEVAVSQDAIGFSKTLKTDKRGRFTLPVLDATRVYTFRFSKAGMPPTSDMFKIDAGGTSRHTFTLASQAEAAPADVAPPAAGNRAVNTFNDGVRALQADDRATAQAKFEEVVEIAPEMPQPYPVLAKMYLDAEEYDRAIDMANRLLELSPDDPAALVVLYDAYTAKGEAASAAQYLDRLSGAGGTEAAIRVFNAGADAARAGSVDAAITLFSKAVEIDPELAPAHAALARLLLGKERFEEALAAADAARAIDPELLEVQRVRYEAYRRLGQEDRAREVFAELAAADPAGLADTLYERGKAAFEAGDSAQALQALEQAIQAKPDHARAHYMLGLAYASAGDSGKAKQHLQRFVELAPDDPEAATAKEMIAYMG